MNLDEVRSSAYDDGNFFLADIDNIGPKGFWLFGKVVHEVPGVPVADRPEGYIGAFSNQRPEWLSLENDEEIYERRMDEASGDAIEKLEDEIDDALDELEDDDNVGYVNSQLIEDRGDPHGALALPPGHRAYRMDRLLEEGPDGRRTSRFCRRGVARSTSSSRNTSDFATCRAHLETILARDYFADRDWYVNGKNIWIVQVGSKDESGSYEAFKDRLSRAKVTIDDNGDMECTYHMPLPGEAATPSR